MSRAALVSDDKCAETSVTDGKEKASTISWTEF